MLFVTLASDVLATASNAPGPPRRARRAGAAGAVHLHRTRGPSAIGEIAMRVYREHYGRPRPWKAGARDLSLLGKISTAVPTRCTASC
jgi:hypothetical protein